MYELEYRKSDRMTSFCLFSGTVILTITMTWACGVSRCCRRFASVEVLGVSPRPDGGGGAESAPLPDFRDNSKTVVDIDTKFGVPYHTSI